MLMNYLKTAVMVFMRRKFFTFVSLFGIAFTLGVVLAVASVFDQTFYGYKPETNSQRMLGIYRSHATFERENGKTGNTTGMASYHILQGILPNLPNVEETAIHRLPLKAISYSDGKRVDVAMRYADDAYWRVLQFDFLEGRPFTTDEWENAAPVAVINRATRDKYFGNRPAVGRVVEADNMRLRIVGVVENVSVLRYINSFFDVCAPYTLISDIDQMQEAVGLFSGLILADSRADFPLIREEVIDRVRRIKEAQDRYTNIVIVPESQFQMIARTLFSFGAATENQAAKLHVVLVVLALIFMVLPAINLINLNISRILERSGEIGVRKSFGASSRVLVGQFFFENLFLTLIGGVLAVGVSMLILNVITSAGWIPYAHFSLNWRILLIGLGAVLAFGVLSGVYPAWRMSRMNPVDALKGGA
jgi:putative ABC transport system permease protein